MLTERTLRSYPSEKAVRKDVPATHVVTKMAHPGRAGRSEMTPERLEDAAMTDDHSQGAAAARPMTMLGRISRFLKNLGK